MTGVEFQNQAVKFLVQLFDDLEKNSVKLDPNWDVDHLCYRVDSVALYEACKKDFSQFADLLIESDVNGRPIATYKLVHPLQFRNWQIQLVELPAPKKSKPVATGFEHIEVVCDAGFDVLSERFKHLKLDLGGLQKDFNKEFEISLGARNIKFHHLSLESVISLEKNRKVYDALKKSDVLRVFKKYEPLVSGTFPLDIHTPESDIDILMSAVDLMELKGALIEQYGKLNGFDIQKFLFDGAETLTAQFKVDGVPFEIFAQTQKTTAQAAFLHFLIEERLLKLGGKKLKEEIQVLRAKGFKTEPAFAEALKLNGDCYKELLMLQKKSNQELQMQFFMN